ncbi:hypothetical protein [Microbacterium azadirachtae]|jgi:hypothetical protein|uniref:hypothetical protein n=1 Tax=Microbacterium azadirachtae TaxID=582680 RepID=UPI003F753415
MSRIVAAAVGGPPRVDLLPRSEVDRREREKLSAVWVRIGLLALLLAAVLIGAAFVWNQFAQQQLVAEQDRSTQLLAQIGQLNDVSGALATEGELNAFRGEAMGSDLAWSGILDRVRSALPADTTVTGFELTPGAVPDPAAKDKDAAKKAIGLTGTLTIDSPNALDLGALARGLRGVGGVLAADGRASTASQQSPGRYIYTIDVTFDQTVYSGRYAKEATK